MIKILPKSALAAHVRSLQDQAEASTLIRTTNTLLKTSPSGVSLTPMPKRTSPRASSNQVARWA